MNNVKIGNNIIMTEEFYRFIISNLNQLYPNNHGKVKINIDSLQYRQWNDMDQPGIDERLTFTLTDNRKFRAAMTHNRWEEFKEVI